MKVVPDDMSNCPLTGFPSGPQSTTTLRIIRNRKMVNCVAKTSYLFTQIVFFHDYKTCMYPYRLIELSVILPSQVGAAGDHTPSDPQVLDIGPMRL